MACRTMLRSICLVEPWRPLASTYKFLKPNHLNCACRKTNHKAKSYHHHHFAKRTQPLNCSNNNNNNYNQDPVGDENDQGPPQEAVLKAISEVSKTEGRVGQTTNVVIGGTVTDDSSNEWLALDQKVNSYPTVRGFTAIGTGGDDFVHAMVVAVESVLQHPIPEGQVKQKISSGGKYVSVNIGPVQVVSSEQVQAVYNAMRRDDRMKYFL